MNQLMRANREIPYDVEVGLRNKGSVGGDD